MAKNNYKDYTKEQLIEELKKLSKRKKYGLVWEEETTKEKFEAEVEGKLPVLVEDKKRELKADDEMPTHILIEGDNYHALSVLNYTHARNIDVIYIDPPYNTGSKDWKYNNDYVEKEDSFRHSKWLSFMSKRLKLAKKLLSPKGVLICTIDENEHSTLELLLQEIFPSYEIVGVVIVHNPAGVQGKNFSYTHEFAFFVYPNKGKYISDTERDKELISPLRDWGGTSARKLAKNCFYPIIVKDNKIIGFGSVCDENFHPKSANIKQKDGSIYIYPIDNAGVERKWVFSKNSAEKNVSQLFVKEIKGELVIKRNKNLFTHRTVWTDKKYYANIYGSKLLNSIIPVKFPFPKSLYAVKDCIKAVIHDNQNAIILDFFAGSGTTGHAVLELNKEDGGKRQFILCTNNENNISTEVTYPRLKNVMLGYKSLNTDKVLLYEKKITQSIFDNCIDIKESMELIISNNEKMYEKIEKEIEDNSIKIYGIKNNEGFKSGLGGNLKYYKTNFVGSEPTHRNKRLLTEKSVEMLCIKENTFEVVLNKSDISIYKSKSRYTAILFNELKMDEFKKEIAKLKLPISVYVFSLEGDDFNEEFEDLHNDITLCSIPEAILKVYRRIYETAKPRK